MLIEGLKCFSCNDHSGRIDTIKLIDNNLAPYINMLPQLSLFTKDVTLLRLSGALETQQGKDCTKKLELMLVYFLKLEILTIK